VILITHIEPVREGLDRVITVSYDPDNGASIVSQSEGDERPVDDLRSRGDEPPPSRRRREQEEHVETAEAGAGAA
jgi:hypothetical protein